MADTYVIGECYLWCCPACAPAPEVKPGWCPVHPGRPEPCFVCSMAVRGGPDA